MSVQPVSTVHPSSGGVFAFLSNLRIGPKIIAGYLLLIVLMAGVAGTAYWGINRIITADQLALKRQADTGHLFAMEARLLEQYAHQSDLILNDNPAMIEAFQANIKDMDGYKEEAQSSVDMDNERQWMAEIDQLDEQFDALFLDQVVPAWRAGNKDLLKKLDGQSDELIGQIQDKTQKMIASYETEVVEANRAADDAHREITLLMLAISVVASIAGLIFGVVVARSISNPVQKVALAATRLAVGDVDQELTIYSRNEIGQMADCFRQMIAYQQEMAGAAGHLAQGDVSVNVTPQSNKDRLGNAFSQMITHQQQMAQLADQLAQGNLTVNITPQSNQDVLGKAFGQMIANLRDLIGQVTDTANTVGVASDQLSTAAEQAGQATQQVAGTIQQIAQGTTQQTQAVTEAANNVTQMARASEGIARGAQEQAQSITKTSDLTIDMAAIVAQVGQTARSVSDANAKVTQAARSGVSTVGQTSQGMEAIRTRTLAAAEKIKDMGHRSKEIGRIVETIDDIADKTDMLALNAAVEAARAGEYGRGFAVVADQVRKLSEDSKAATRDIGDLIERVQETIREAVTAMDSTTLEVDNGVRLTGDTTRSLGEILQAAENAAALAEQITTAVGQLKQKSEGVVVAIETVTAVVEENTAVAEEMAASSQEVTQAMEGVAGVAEENSAAAEEVSASAEEMSAQVEEVVASAQELSSLAEQLRAAVAQFQLEESSPPQHQQPVSISTRRLQPKHEPVLAGHHGNGHHN